MPLTESQFLERTRTALTNSETNNEIKTALADYGMTSEKIVEGKKVYENTKDVFEHSENEKAETEIASGVYKKSFSELEVFFKRHRKQTSIFFKKNPEILVTLGVKGRLPSTYSGFFEKVSQFYGGIKKNPAIQTEMKKIKITSPVVAEGLKMLDNLLANRAEFDREMGESQDATKSKNAAFEQLEEWMDDFDSIAKVALFDRPQLLEALGIFVRS